MGRNGYLKQLARFEKCFVLNKPWSLATRTPRASFMKAVIVLLQPPGWINSESDICSARAPRVFGNKQIAPKKFFPPVCVLVLTQITTFTIGITRTR